ncbi:cytochrome P450 [Streptomyces malaysiensis]|uniref:cytochrome P450 n=1 Tax=Streptomyces malaysiensis TaxID=92644 RepID=UPI002B2B0B00|nr:cytochrome P450 [Streptomyces malaysiensis]
MTFAPVTTPTSDADLFSDENLNDPFPLFARLRTLGPAVWMRKHNAWAVAGYDDIKAVLADHDLFSSFPNPALEPQRPEIPQGGPLGSDPPDHTRLRAILSEKLAPRALRTLRQDIERQADNLIAEVVERSEVEVVSQVAQEFPIRVVTRLVGLPDGDYRQLLILADAAFNSFGPANERTLASLPAVPGVWKYIAQSMSRESIAPDSWGAAVYDAVDRGDVTEEEAIHLLSSYLIPSMDTTINAIGSAIGLLAEYPDVWAAVRRDPQLVKPALEETLRFESPVMFFARGATRDTTIGSQPIRAGDRVVTLMPSGNRDERHFHDPDSFDISRTTIDHLAFGHGIHSCVGQGLARMEGQAILKAWARHVRNMEIVGKPERRLNNTIRGLSRLQLQVVADRG